MRDQNSRTLVASSNSGRFALDDPETGPDLASGDVIEINLGGQWIRGSIERTRKLYPLESSLEQILRKEPIQVAPGYYFIASGGGVCGLWWV